MVPMLLLTSVHGSFPARVLAARLESEGLDVELRGALDSPYGLMVGDMSRVDLWIPEDQLDDARLVMLVSEVDDAMALPDHLEGTRRGRPRWAVWAAVVVIVAAVLAPVARLLF